MIGAAIIGGLALFVVLAAFTVAVGCIVIDAFFSNRIP